MRRVTSELSGKYGMCRYCHFNREDFERERCDEKMPIEKY
jgi:hypothetical protein